MVIDLKEDIVRRCNYQSCALNETCFFHQQSKYQNLHVTWGTQIPTKIYLLRVQTFNVDLPHTSNPI